MKTKRSGPIVPNLMEFPHTSRGTPAAGPAALPSVRARRSISQEPRGTGEDERGLRGTRHGFSQYYSVDDPVTDDRCGRSPHRSRSIRLELNEGTGVATLGGGATTVGGGGVPASL
jgi:hypothetical protein